MSELTNHKVVSSDEWLAARKELLAEEKELGRARERLTRLRQELPWELVEKQYSFDGPLGTETLADLFDGRSQLIVYHFMYGPDWDEGCPHCALRADGFDGIIRHLEQRDVTMVAVSRAPLAKLEAFQQHMGWTFNWLSSHGTDFNRDYCVSFTPEEVESQKAFYNYEIRDPEASEREGHSVFYKDEAGSVFHTYSCYHRGNENLANHYHYLDLVPKGRDEGGRGPYWVDFRDQYR